MSKMPPNSNEPSRHNHSSEEEPSGENNPDDAITPLESASRQIKRFYQWLYSQPEETQRKFSEQLGRIDQRRREENAKNANLIPKSILRIMAAFAPDHPGDHESTGLLPEDFHEEDASFVKWLSGQPKETKQHYEAAANRFSVPLILADEHAKMAAEMEGNTPPGFAKSVFSLMKGTWALIQLLRHIGVPVPPKGDYGNLPKQLKMQIKQTTEQKNLSMALYRRMIDDKDEDQDDNDYEDEDEPDNVAYVVGWLKCSTEDRTTVEVMLGSNWDFFSLSRKPKLGSLSAGDSSLVREYILKRRHDQGALWCDISMSMNSTGDHIVCYATCPKNGAGREVRSNE